MGVKEGQADPHWQIVARSDDPAFKPKSAVVASMKGPWFMANDSERSQWISLGGDKPKLPDGVTYTFRTTFQLADATHQAVLRGGFMADNHVAAIRLNGRSLVVPEHGYESRSISFIYSRQIPGSSRGRT